MRIALFILLFSNLVFLAWSQWVDVPRRGAVLDATASLPRLKLAGELPGAAAPVSTPAAGPAATPAAVPAQRDPAGACVTVGPFDDASGASRGADLLKKKGIAAQERTQEGTAGQGFWVIVGGLGNDASAALQKLTEAGIEDARVLQASNKERRISVGLYTAKDQASQRLEAVRRLGLRATIADRSLPATQHWVDVATDGPVPANELYHGPMSKIGVAPCPAGASPPTASTAAGLMAAPGS